MEIRKTSETGINLIKSFEGCKYVAYLCPAGILTIGYGRTKDVKPGQMITKAQAEQLLKEDLEVFEKGVLDLVKVPLNQNQFDALVSFSFNLGLGSLKKSTLLKLLNKKDYVGASKEFLRWNKANGKALAGLTRRRIAEQVLFTKPIA